VDATDLQPLIPRLIVGLGNPGDNYRDTRHNIGFMILDEVARRLQVSYQPEKRWACQLARCGSTWLQKPQTYMNESGRAVGGLSRYQKIAPAETLVVFDDVDLPLGVLRIRLAGSAAGHNGIKSLITTLGTDAFPRIKVGIATSAGRPAGDRMVGHVLGRFSEEERPTLLQVIDRAADAIIYSLQHGLATAMNLFNRK
jgi:peptidyl-tRNA hydrolase, PTH1 family